PKRSRHDRLLLWHWWAPQGPRHDPRKLSRTVRGAHFDVSVRAGISLPEYSSDESRHRFHGRFFRSVHLWGNGCSFANATPGICPRSLHEIQNHLRKSRSACPQKSTERPAGPLRRVALWKAQGLPCPCGHQQGIHEDSSTTWFEPPSVEASP